MIAKRVGSQKGTSDIKRLVKYVSDDKGHGAKVRGIWATNCAVSDDIELATMEMSANQALNTRSQNDKTYHLVVSLAEGEDLTDVQWREVETAFCKAIGLGEHQRICAIHTDTNHIHMHLAISKVHPEKLTCIEPYYDKLKLLGVCRELERSYGLKPGIGQSQALVRQSASEAHRGLESFACYLRENLASELISLMNDTQGSWKGAHELCGRFGVEIRERGAGIVFSHRERNLFVKASSVDKNLSKAKFERCFGSFEKSSFEGHSEKIYVVGPTRVGSKVKILYAQYQSLKEAELAKYHGNIQPLFESRSQRVQEIKDRYAKRRLEIKMDTLIAKGKKRFIYQKVSQEMRRELDDLFKQSRDQRQKARDALKTKTWRGWLWEQACNGDEDALGVLRSKKSKILDKGVGVFVGDSPHSKIFSGLKRRVMDNGVVEYQTASGGIIVDTGREIFVKNFDHSVVNAAINMAKVAFKNGHRIEGSKEFTEYTKRQEVGTKIEKEKDRGNIF